MMDKVLARWFPMTRTTKAQTTDGAAIGLTATAPSVNQGIRVFTSINHAIASGYQVVDSHYEVSPGRFGMLVKIRTATGWAQAIVAPPRHGDAA